jgi:hypothetical protein
MSTTNQTHVNENSSFLHNSLHHHHNNQKRKYFANSNPNHNFQYRNNNNNFKKRYIDSNQNTNNFDKSNSDSVIEYSKTNNNSNINKDFINNDKDINSNNTNNNSNIMSTYKNYKYNSKNVSSEPIDPNNDSVWIRCTLCTKTTWMKRDEDVRPTCVNCGISFIVPVVLADGKEYDVNVLSLIRDAHEFFLKNGNLKQPKIYELKLKEHLYNQRYNYNSYNNRDQS